MSSRSGTASVDGRPSLLNVMMMFQQGASSLMSDVIRHLPPTRELCWLSVPTKLRNQVWRLSIGNELQRTPELYHIFRSHGRCPGSARGGGGGGAPAVAAALPGARA